MQLRERSTSLEEGNEYPLEKEAPKLALPDRVSTLFIEPIDFLPAPCNIVTAR